MRKKLYFMLIALALGSGITQAQQVTGNLEGRILTLQSEPLAGANVVVTSPSLQGERGAACNTQGYFRVVAIPAGVYSVRISHIGYQDITYENVLIRLGKTTTLGEIPLAPKSIEMPKVVVFESKPIIDPTSTTVGVNLTSQIFETLPTERSFRSIVALSPQANVSYLGDEINIAGSTGLENAYFIDGMNVTDPYTAVTSTNLPYNFVKEIEVKTGGYEAEFGRAQGGIINVITHSGGNDFQVKAFGFFTDNRLAADSRFGFLQLDTGDFAKYDVGVSLNGPIKRDKLWYFLAYNANVEKQDITFAGLGIRSDERKSHLFAGKLTWRAGPQTSFVLTVLGDPTKWDRIGHNYPGSDSPSALANPDPFLGNWEEGGINSSLKATHLTEKNLLLEAIISRYDVHRKAEPATERGRKEALFLDLPTGIWSGGYGNAFDHYCIRTAGSLAATYFWGKHVLKTGFQYEDNFLDQDWRWQSEQANGAGFVLKQTDSLYVALPLDFQADARNRILTFFAQGSFAVHPRLRLNAGFRWDGQYLQGVERNLKESITDQYQPRLGFVYQVDKAGSQQVTGSFGRFYEQIPNLFTSFYFGPLEQEIFLYFHNPIDDPSEGVLISGPQSTAKDLIGQHYDEFTLGYEKQIKESFKLGIRGVYRTVREIIQDALDPETGIYLVGNPGRGILNFLPKPKREYAALEITIEKARGRNFNFMSSYVLSRNYGNYTGLYDSDFSFEVPNSGSTFDYADQLKDGTGLLPNDRTHVFKFFGSYKFDIGFLVGTGFIWQSGTPLNEFGAFEPDPFVSMFLRPRGTAGRTSSIWDLNFRLTYDFNRLIVSSIDSKLILDLFHVFSQRKAVNIEQKHFLAVDENGNQVGVNPNYLKPLLYQPPMTLRLGLEVGF